MFMKYYCHLVQFLLQAAEGHVDIGEHDAVAVEGGDGLVLGDVEVGAAEEGEQRGVLTDQAPLVVLRRLET